MPYSMEAADALNGYSSGMPYAGFYQRIWDNMFEKEAGQESQEAPQASRKAVLDLGQYV